MSGNTEAPIVNANFDAITDYQQYKSVADIAFPLALDSYKEAERRLEVVEKRIQDMLSFAISATLGVTALSIGKADLHSTLFVVALISALAGIMIGFYTRCYGNLKLISLTKIHQSYMSATETEFKVEFIEFAGKHSDFNSSLCFKKARLTAIAASFFLCEVILLGVWAVVQKPSANLQSPVSGLAAAGQLSAASHLSGQPAVSKVKAKQAKQVHP